MSRPALDAVDRSILGLLVEDGRRSASEIGRRVNLSPAAAKRRIDRLGRLGVITGYNVVIDHAKLGSTIEAFVELRFEAHTQVENIDSAFVTVPEVVESFTLAGDPDALVRLRVGSLDHLKQVINSIRSSDRVASTKTLIVLGTAQGTPSGRPSARR